MKNALELHVHVGADHLVQLPDEVPIGPADIIVLIEGAPDATAEVLDDFEPIVPAFDIRLSDLVLQGRG